MPLARARILTGMMSPVSSAHEAPPVPGAGGVVLRGPHVLMVRYKSGAWAFPKGHLESGETPQQAALREVQEETGVAAQVVAPLSTTRYTNDRLEAREIHWFLMTTSDTSAASLEDTFGEGGFVETGEASQRLSYPEDRALLAEALERWNNP